MKTSIFDKGSGEFIKKAFQAAANIFGKHLVNRIDRVAQDRVDVLRRATLAIGHMTDADFQKMIEEPPATLRVVIRVSSLGRSGFDNYKLPCRLSEKGPWILHLIEPSALVDEKKWEEIFLALKEWNTDRPSVPKNIAAIFEPHPENLLALRLLCEAWIFVKEQKTAGGIAVRGPKIPADWFKPFGKEFPSEADAEEIAKLMGEAEAEAKELLKSVCANNGEKIEAGIISFLSKVQKTKTPA